MERRRPGSGPPAPGVMKGVGLETIIEGRGLSIFNEGPLPTDDGDPVATLLDMTEQARLAIDHDLYLPALATALLLPDICGALASANGNATRAKTIKWLVDHGGQTQVNAELIYGFRCSLAHQGSGSPHRVKGVRVAFVMPQQGLTMTPHWLTTKQEDSADLVLWVTASLFVDDICDAVDAWVRTYGSSDPAQKNLHQSLRVRPQGLARHFHGGAVLA